LKKQVKFLGRERRGRGEEGVGTHENRGIVEKKGPQKKLRTRGRGKPFQNYGNLGG